MERTDPNLGSRRGVIGVRPLSSSDGCGEWDEFPEGRDVSPFIRNISKDGRRRVSPDLEVSLERRVESLDEPSMS